MLETPDLVSAGVILIAVLINLVIGIKSFKSYRENKLTQTLLFALTAFFMAIAMLLLIAEKLFITIGNDDMGMLFGLIAITLSGFAVVSIDAFSFNMVFPSKFKILTVLAALVEAAYLIVWYSDPGRIVAGGEIKISDFTTWLSFFTLAPLLIIPVLVFFYYAIKVRDESPISSKRSWMLGLGVLVIAIGFIVEIAGLEPEAYSWVLVGARSLFILGAVLLYWGLFKIRAPE